MSRCLHVYLFDSREERDAYDRICKEDPGTAYEWGRRATIDGMERPNLPDRFNGYNDTLENLMNEV